MDCSDCTNKTCLKTKKPCKEIEALMSKQGIYSIDYIRPQNSSKNRFEGYGQNREIPVDNVDDVATQRALHLRGGKKDVKRYPETQ